MVGPSLLLLALLGPSPDPSTDTATPAQPPEASAPEAPFSVDGNDKRGYTGPQVVDAPDGQTLPDVVDPNADDDDDADDIDDIDADDVDDIDDDDIDADDVDDHDHGHDHDHDHDHDDIVVPPTPPGAKPRPIPRPLSSLHGYPTDEVATFGKGRAKFSPGMQLRNQIGRVTAFQLDRLGNDYDEGAISTGRLRISPRFDWSTWFSLVGTLDLINGRWAPVGSTDPIVDRLIAEGQPPGQTQLRLADPRELYVELRPSFGLFRIGQQSFTWGQGILANSGNTLDRFGDLRFGSDSTGDIYERVLFATKPFRSSPGNIQHLVVGVGGDLVFRDERAQLTRGDLAGQGLVVLRYEPPGTPGNWVGGYAVFRRQRNAEDGDIYPDDDDLRVGVFDVAGQGTAWLRDDLQLIGAFEAALITGRAEIVRDEDGDHALIQGGATVRGYVGDHDRWLVGFDGGYASGDPNPGDRFINNFTFDAGHTVGLIMFNQIRGWRTARSEILAQDPNLTGIPSNGLEFIPTRGGVTNALYLHPKARWALRERLEVWGGPLIAAAPTPVVDPYTSQLGGGVPINSVGGDGQRRFYGTELDLGVRGRFELKGLWLQAGLQGALLMPGAAMANAGGNTGGPVGAVWFRTQLRY